MLFRDQIRKVLWRNSTQASGREGVRVCAHVGVSGCGGSVWLITFGTDLKCDNPKKEKKSNSGHFLGRSNIWPLNQLTHHSWYYDLLIFRHVKWCCVFYTFSFHVKSKLLWYKKWDTTTICTFFFKSWQHYYLNNDSHLIVTKSFGDTMISWPEWRSKLVPMSFQQMVWQVKWYTIWFTLITKILARSSSFAFKKELRILGGKSRILCSVENSCFHC